MKKRIAVAFCIVVSTCLGLAQADAPASPATDIVDRGQIENVLEMYTGAYEHRDLNAMFKVFPELQNNRKELHRTQERFDNPRISNTHLELKVLEVEPTENGVVVKCKRTEKYDEVQYSSYDGDMGGQPVHRSAPFKTEEKKAVSKSNDVWLSLRRNGENWKIGSIAEKQPR